MPSAYLSARISQKQRVQTAHTFLYMLPVAVAWFSSDDNTLCTSGFVHDVTFAHNRRCKGGANKAYPQSDSPGGRNGAKSLHMICLVLISIWFFKVACFLVWVVSLYYAYFVLAYSFPSNGVYLLQKKANLRHPHKTTFNQKTLTRGSTDQFSNILVDCWIFCWLNWSFQIPIQISCLTTVP